MKKIVLAVLVGTFVFISSSASSLAAATDDVYMSFKVGLNGAHTATLDGEDLDPSVGGFAAVAVGRGLSMFRAEVEMYGNRTGLEEEGTEEGRIATMAVFLNGYLDLKNATILTPYVGAGAGAVKVMGRIGSESDNDTVLTLQVAAGLGIEISRFVTLELGYRRLIRADVTFDKYDVEGEYGDHTGFIALRVKAAAFLR